MSQRATLASTGAVAWIGVALSAAAGIAALTPLPTAIALPVVLAFACFGPGCAVVSHAPTLGRATAWALALTFGLAIFVGDAAVLAWTGWWHPAAGLLALALASAASCVIALVRSRTPLREVRPRADWLAAYANRRTALDAAVFVVALLVWAFSLGRTDITTVGPLGFLATVNPLFFLAPVLAVGGFVAELRRGARRGLVAVAYLVLLIVVIHGSTPALLEVPQYAWTYKHLGVVDYFLQVGRVTAANDIYQQWPAFFAAAAQVISVSGVNPLVLAQWSPVFFNLAGSLMVFAIARQLTPDRRVAFAAAGLLQCINWIEEDYFSPQALAYLLGLGVFLLVVTYLRRVDGVARAGWAVAGVAVVMATLTATHQLSPYLVAGSVVLLAVLRLVRPWWIAAVVVAIPVAYLVPRFAYVSSSFDLFAGFDLFRKAAAWGTAGPAFSAIVVRGLSLAVGAVTAFALWRARSEPRRVLLPAVLAIVPVGLVLAQNYGGEPIYRVFLFAAPWCAYLIADLAVRSRPRRANLAAATAVLAMTAALLGSMQGRHGQLMVDRQTTAELAASRFLYANAVPGSAVLLADPNFPGRFAPNYDDVNRGLAYDPDLVTTAQLSGAVLNNAYLPLINAFADAQHTPTTYLVVSDGMRRYAEYFGALPAGSLDALKQTLASSGEWTVFFRNPEVTIYSRSKRQQTGPTSGQGSAENVND